MTIRNLTGALLLCLLAGCAGTKESAMAPAAAPASPSVVNVAEEGQPSAPMATSPDGYPTFSAPLSAANTQMDNEQAAAISAQLSSLAAKRQAGAVSEAEYQRRVAELRKLAAQHGTDVEAGLAN